MKKRLSLLLLFLVAGIYASFGQKQNVYYLKNNGRLVYSTDSADFIRVVREPDSGSVLYNVMEYYPKGQKKRFTKSSKIDPVLSLEGQSLEYYPNGRRKSVGNYKHNILAGEFYTFFPNGNLYTIEDYGVPDTIPKYQAGGSAEPLIKTCNDSTGKVLVVDGNGRYPVYDSGFKTITEEGSVKNGRKSGEWKGTAQKGRISFTETYEDGNLISGSAADSAGTYTYKTRYIYPRYQTGIEGFYRYLGTWIRYPDIDRRTGLQGTVLLTFTVTKTSSIKNIKVVRSVSSTIDAEAVRIVAGSKNWLPGAAYGRLVDMEFTIPIKFTLQ